MQDRLLIELRTVILTLVHDFDHVSIGIVVAVAAAKRLYERSDRRVVVAPTTVG